MEGEQKFSQSGQEEFEKLTSEDADEKINKSLNRMGDVEFVETDRDLDESDAMNRELDKIGKTSVPESEARERAIDLANNLSGILKKFLEQGIIDQNMRAYEIPAFLEEYRSELEKMDKEENEL